MKPVLLSIEVADFGCLPGLLAKEIAAVERHRGASSGRYTPEEAGMVEEYLRQLRACLAVAQNASRAA